MDVVPSFTDFVAAEGIYGDGNNTGGDGISEVMVCLQLANGILQRNVSVNVRTISTPTATGTLH